MVTEAGGRRRRHSAAERRAVLARFAASGASVAAFWPIGVDQRGDAATLAVVE